MSQGPRLQVELECISVGELSALSDPVTVALSTDFAAQVIWSEDQ